MPARNYQNQIADQTMDAWNAGRRNVLMVMPTGAGKTFTKTMVVSRARLVTVCIAHRQELVLQISESLAAAGIYHRIIAPPGVVKFCTMRHVQKFGRSYFNANADVACAGVRTLTRRQDQLRTFIPRVRLWDIDEAHHVLPGNEWGKAVDLFPHAYGLGVTATPLRADRKGLDGVFDHMIVGPSMRELIDDGYLSEYRIFCPPESIDTAGVELSAGGDYKPKQLSDASERSQITGDVVAHYLKIAPGKRGLTFAVDVKAATKIAEAYNHLAPGVNAAVVTAKTPDNIRTELLDRLARGDVKQLVNVDLFGEGMDCPALEVVSMARPTQSYGLYVQQFGRVLRLMDGKTHGIVIDHVGNVMRHGLPDKPRQWSLSAPEGRRASASMDDTIGLKACTGCFKPYERHLVACPYCGFKPEPESRISPKEVDGNLIELNADVLAQMRGEIARIDGDPLIPYGASDIVAAAVRKHHRARQEQQHQLRECMAAWGGMFKHGHGESDPEIQKRFYLTFGVDVASAQSLNAKDAATLAEKIRSQLT